MHGSIATSACVTRFTNSSSPSSNGTGTNEALRRLRRVPQRALFQARLPSITVRLRRLRYGTFAWSMLRLHTTISIDSSSGHGLSGHFGCECDFSLMILIVAQHTCCRPGNFYTTDRTLLTLTDRYWPTATVAAVRRREQAATGADRPKEAVGIYTGCLRSRPRSKASRFWRPPSETHLTVAYD